MIYEPKWEILYMTKEQLEKGRYIGRRIYGYKKSYCNQMSSCEMCDPVVRLWCRIIRHIEDIQIKRINKICK